MTEPLEALQPAGKRGSARSRGKASAARCLAGVGALIVAGVLGSAVQAAPKPAIVGGFEHRAQANDGAVHRTPPDTETSVTFECPQASASDSRRRLFVSADMAESLKSAEPAEDEERISEIVAKLRTKNADPDIIVDTLVATYCPLVASEKGLTAAEKTARVSAFAHEVRDIAFSEAQQRVRGVRVDVTLTPEILHEVDRAARSSGVARDTWLARAIEKALPAAQ